MNLNTLPSRFFHPVGFRKDGRPIFPIAGGSEPPNQQTGQNDQQTDPPQNQGPVEAVDEQGNKLGFPEKTPVEQMNADQKAAYWRNEAKKANKRVPGNLDQLQRDAQAWAEHQRSLLPEEQRKAAEREEQIRNETRAATLREANQQSALALLRVTLQTRGKNPAEVEEIVDPLNPAKFLNDQGELDTGKVLALADKLAPSRSGGGGNGMGQGRYDSPPQSRAEAGHKEAERRGFVKSDQSGPAKRNSFLLPQQ